MNSGDSVFRDAESAVGAAITFCFQNVQPGKSSQCEYRLCNVGKTERLLKTTLERSRDLNKF